MLVSVQTQRGPSPVTVDVQHQDEGIARKVAYRWVYFGDTLMNDQDTEFPVTDQLLDEYTSVIKCVKVIIPT